MIRIYPGWGLNAERSLLGFNLLEPVLAFDGIERWIQREAREPVLAASGMAAPALVGAEPMLVLSGLEPARQVVDPVLTPTLSGRRASLLTGREPGGSHSAPGHPSSVSGQEPFLQQSGNEAPDIEGNEYDDSIEGKELGWPKS